MSILLHKSCSRLQQSRIRYFSHWHPVQFCQSHSSPPKTTRTFARWSSLTSSSLSRHSTRLLVLTTNKSSFIYPTTTCYSTLAIQSTMTQPELSTTSESTPPRRQQQQQHLELQQHCYLTESLPIWIKECQKTFTKVQQRVDTGQYEAALELANTVPLPHDIDIDAIACYAELLDPYSIILEQRLEQGKWDQGIAEYHQLLSTPLGSILPFNRRAVKATLLFYCVKGQWDDVDRMLVNLKITMTPKTVGRMMTTLMKLKIPPHPKARTMRPTNQYAVKGKNIVRSLQAFERKLDIQVNSQTLAKIVGYLGDRGSIGDSYRLYRWARGEKSHSTNIRPPTQTHRCSKSIIYLAMMEAAIKNNDTAKAEIAWHERIHRGIFSNDPNAIKFKPATLSAYNILMNIYASQLPLPKLSRVRRTYRRLLNAGYKPNTYTYNTLIKAFVNAGDPDKAYQMFDTMIHSDNTRPDSRSINLLLRGWIEKKEWHNVELFVKRLQQLDPLDLDKGAGGLDDKYTFNIMLQGFLCLNGKCMAINRLLKAHGDWYQWRQLAATLDDPYSLPSHTIWEIFESATGFTANQLEDSLTVSALSASSSTRITTTLSKKNVFNSLFNQQGFNQVSCFLFIKAFTLAKDPLSAELVKKWMYSSYPPSPSSSSLSSTTL